MKESELALHFIEYFSEGFELYKEVPNRSGGIVDFYATDGKLAYAVEVKTSLSIALIEQGYRNLPYAHYSYIASPSHPSKIIIDLCLNYGIGVLVWQAGMVRERVKPRLNRKAQIPKFHEYQKENIAGSVNDRTTAFQDFINEITRICYLDYRTSKEGLELKEVYERLNNRYYANITICRRNLMAWINNGVIKEFRIEGKRIFLNEEYIREKRKKEFESENNL
jgi:hypothetical protein